MKLFRHRFRSPLRDSQTDQSRTSAIRRSVQLACASAEKELNGLRARHRSAREAASSIMGTDWSDCSDRESTTTAELRVAEGNLLVAERRIRQVTDQLKGLKQIEALLDVVFRPPGLSSTQDATHV